MPALSLPNKRYPYYPFVLRIIHFSPWGICWGVHNLLCRLCSVGLCIIRRRFLALELAITRLVERSGGRHGAHYNDVCLCGVSVIAVGENLVSRHASVGIPAQLRPIHCCVIDAVGIRVGTWLVLYCFTSLSFERCSPAEHWASILTI